MDHRPISSLRRRDVLAALCAGALPSWSSAKEQSKPLRGIFPIAQTPFTEAGKLDLDDLRKQVEFLHRCGVHGIVWPQLASEWSTLTQAERMEGAEVMVAAGKKLRPAVVIGVQSAEPGDAVKYARHAAGIGADALIALPPPNQSDPKALLEYYREIGRASDLPLFAQAVGNMSVDLLLEMMRAIPTLRYVKDEAGEPLMRMGPLRAKSGDELKIFTGGHGRTLIDEMSRGSSGTMPAASFADLYVSVWDLWQAGKHQEAMDLFGKTLLFITEVQVYGIESLKYILQLRGVFKTSGSRRGGGPGGAPGARMLAAGGLQSRGQLDDDARKVLKELLEYCRPHLRA
jgi:4-hydroxy-tetrahydrodipicolinate synthase